MKKLRAIFLGILALPVAGAVGGFVWMNNGVAPTEPGKHVYLRFDDAESFDFALRQLETKGIVRNATALKAYAKLRGQAHPLIVGTFEFKSGMKADEVLHALYAPVKRMVRIPEGWWIQRVGKRLEDLGICSKDDYVKAASNVDALRKIVPIPPGRKNAEGYLYPDTYDIPPGMPATQIVTMQAATFKKKAADIGNDKQIDKILNIAAMVQAEVALDRERPIVAGVIENRLRKGMPLQIDATVLYALGVWKQLGPGVVNKVDHPYNTYRHTGLPPGPIASPTIASIKAAANPANTPYLYYVAMPDKSHLFAKTYQDHQQNIRKSRLAFAKVRP
jgi:UPF0755 protein